LFFLGILIQLAALLGEHAEEIPLVIKIIAPSFFHAREGLKILDESGSLGTNAEGFDEVSKILCLAVIPRLTNETDYVVTSYLNSGLLGEIPIYTNHFYESESIKTVVSRLFSIENVKEMHGNFGDTRNSKLVFDGISYDLHSKDHFFQNSGHGALDCCC
jgi:hypothetical protein